MRGFLLLLLALLLSMPGGLAGAESAPISFLEYALEGCGTGAVLDLMPLADGRLLHYGSYARPDVAYDYPSSSELVMLDSEGNTAWQYPFQSFYETEQDGTGILALPDGRYARMTYNTTYSGRLHFFQADTGHEGESDVIELTNLWLGRTGFIAISAPDGGTLRVHRLDYAGNELAARDYVHSSRFYGPTRIVETGDGGLLMLDASWEVQGFQLTRTDPDGEVRWRKDRRMAGANLEHVFETEDGGAVLLGTLQVDPATDWWDGVFVRLDAQGQIILETALGLDGYMPLGVFEEDGGYRVAAARFPSIGVFSISGEGELLASQVRSLVDSEGNALAVNAVREAAAGALLLGGSIEERNGAVHLPGIVPFSKLPAQGR